jgi:hypothetical protein
MWLRNASGALELQVPEFSSRVVKEGAFCNSIFGYLHLTLIWRFLVGREKDKSVLQQKLFRTATGIDSTCVVSLMC